MAMTADRVIYSQSCGRTNDSKLITYTKGTNGTQVDSMVAPPMSEGLAIINNSLYVSFESGAKPYLSGGKYPLYHLYYSPLGSFINRVTGVVNTSGINLNVRSGPGTSYSIVDQVADGTKVTIRCQIKGETVTGTYGTSNLWDQIGEGKYVSDTYVYTGSDGQVAPTCAP
ncbi:SH3 domain-containing protein [Paenactinomyces guangxiensis]|uniref:SH3 domain-containing protein n=2 Tax=Paenactinomyces guangxiensis TaxID=1490290 RepID=A0A7W1WNF9_9BACL|nr:SH3 domain-containing protein [Paenactinomyces guangxiensis]